MANNQKPPPRAARKPPPAAPKAAAKAVPVAATEDDFGEAEAKVVLEATPGGVVPMKRVARNDPTGGPSSKPGDINATPGRPVVDMDREVMGEKRKLTKKQQDQLAGWRGKTHGKKLDAYFRGQMEDARRKFGHRSVMAGNPDENLIIGIPMPALPIEYLLCQDVFPLGLVLQLLGEAGSLKSAFLYEIFRWFRRAGGGSHLEEVETKWSADLMQSIVGYADDEVNVLVNRCNSVEEWQQRLQYDIKTEKSKLMGTKEEPGPGRTIPICFGVDSIMGKASFETQEKVHEAGFAGRNFPIEALSITSFMKTVPQMIDEWPFALVLNNHLKMGKDSDGNDKRGVAGGRGVNFQESFELETKVRKRKIECADWDGVQIEIQCMKNSFGPSWRKIPARMLWWAEENPSYPDPKHPQHWKQRTVWDWHWSTVKFLTELKGRDAARLKEVGFHIKAEKTSDVDNSAWSSTLGMKSKDAVRWDVLGKMIADSPDASNLVRQALGIKRRPLLAGDYLHQMEGLVTQLP